MSRLAYWRHLWRGGVVYADSINVQPENPSNNTVEANESSYTINGKTTAINLNDEYNRVEGGFKDDGDSNNNTVIFNGGRVTEYCGIFGGSGGYWAGANGNVITVRGVTGTLSSVGNLSGNGRDANNNVINFYDGNVENINGGSADGYGNANNNTVNIFGGTITGIASGGYSDDGESNGNTVNLYDGKVNQIQVGGHNNNTLNIYGGTLESYTIVADSYNNYEDYSDFCNNTVNIHGGSIGNVLIVLCKNMCS